jgi:ceramide glucosyltransferase
VGLRPEAVPGALLLLASAAGIAYSGLACVRLLQFRKRAMPREPRTPPPITVLKPLCGDEPSLFENLCSLCEQDYAEFQIVFGARDPADPALEIARAVASRFPDLDIEIVAGSASAAANPKVGNLLGMIGRARHPLIAIADSDVRVEPGYLAAIAAAFETGKDVGAVTCLYGGLAGASIASRLGAAQINDHFAPSAIVAASMEPLTYCFGATMAVRRDVLEHIGGLQALAQHIGDDYVLGRLVTQAGYRVELAAQLVHTVVTEDALGPLIERELRWNRTIFAQRPAGYAGSAIIYALPIAVLYGLVAHTPAAAAVVAIAAGFRYAQHEIARRTLSPKTPSEPWLVPVRDTLSLFEWAAALLVRRVGWRRQPFDVGEGGRTGRAPRV